MNRMAGLRVSGVRCLPLFLLLACSPAPAADAEAQLAGRTATHNRSAFALPDSVFVHLVGELSEAGGYFDTDNLISNESSYLHVIGALERDGVRGGAYVGVGPDQNFSYIAEIRPEIAFIVDIRADNLVQQLMFKAMFELAENRLEYLTLLYGRMPPSDVNAWTERSLSDVLAYIDGTETPVDDGEAVRERIKEQVLRTGIALSDEDLRTLDRFHLEFIRSGLDLRFQSHGRTPRFFYPDHRQLFSETDLEGRQVSFMASAEAFRVVKELQDKNLVVPVVGDLAGSHALGAIGRHVEQMGLTVSALYSSNVEFYLWQAHTFEQFAETVAGLPASERSVLIRSHFGGGFRTPHPQSQPGYYSTQLLQRIVDFRDAVQAGGFSSYGDVVTRNSVPLGAERIPG